jgi:hypothetical protein
MFSRAGRFARRCEIRNGEKMISVSLKNFIRTGEFGPVRAGLPRDEVTSILGPPDDHSVPSRRFREPEILKYGDFEWHFSRASTCLWLIYTDGFSIPQGGTRLSLDPWIIRGDLTRHTYQAALAEAGIAFTAIDGPDPNNFCVRAESRVSAQFVESEEGFGPPLGLYALSLKSEE